MSRTIMLIPTSAGVGLTSVSMGVLRAMERKGVSVSFYKPIAQPRSGGRSTRSNVYYYQRKQRH